MHEERARAAFRPQSPNRIIHMVATMFTIDSFTSQSYSINYDLSLSDLQPSMFVIILTRQFYFYSIQLLNPYHSLVCVILKTHANEHLIITLFNLWLKKIFSQVTREISFNGFRLDEFVPEKTSAFVSQQDLHIPEMTVREILDYSARFQGVGIRAGKVI